MDSLVLHRGALNLNPLAIIAPDQITAQVDDQLNITQTIERSKKLLDLARDPADYLARRNKRLEDIKAEVKAAIEKTITDATGNGIPAEVRNYMAFEVGKHTAKIKQLLLGFEFPMSDTAINMTTTGNIDAAKIGDAYDAVK